MASNLPPGCTQAIIDRYYGDDAPEPDEDDLAYLDQLEQEAELIPVPFFWECEPERVPVAEQLVLSFADPVERICAGFELRRKLRYMSTVDRRSVLNYN